jgi:transposase
LGLVIPHEGLIGQQAISLPPLKQSKMTETNLMVGIDVSKKNFDIALPNQKGYLSQQYSNDVKGFKQLLKALPPGVQCVMEATGPYYLRLATYLYLNGIKVSVVNPLVIKRFSQMRLLRAKTDKADAKMIAEYGKAEQPALWKPSEGYLLELQQLETVLEQYGRQHTAMLNQQEAFIQSGAINKTVLQSLNQSLKHLEKQCKRVEERMKELIEQQHNDLLIRLSSIPGIGNQTAIMLIAITGGFKKFTTSKQLSSYIGICPRIVESGTSVKGKGKICKLGMSRIRRLLYLCTWSAIKWNSTCKEMYERMISRGKPKMVALIAVANKLLRQAFAIGMSNNKYIKDFQPKACF